MRHTNVSLHQSRYKELGLSLLTDPTGPPFFSLLSKQQLSILNSTLFTFGVNINNLYNSECPSVQTIFFFFFFKPPPVYSTLGVGLGERVTKTAIAIYFHVHLLLRLFCMPDAAFRLFVLKRRRRNFYLLLFIFLAVGHYMVTLVYDEFSTRCATKLDKVPTFFLSFFPSEYSRLGSFTSGKLFQAKYFLGYLGGLVFGACTKTDPIINSVVVFVGKIFISSNYRCVTSNASISSSSFTKMWLPLFCALYVPSKKKLQHQFSHQ